MNGLIQRYQILSQRDQLAVAIGAAFLLFVVVWVLILGPAYSYYARGVQAAQSQSELVSWIEQNRTRFESVSQAGAETGEETDASLIQTLSQIAAGLSVEISRIEPTADGRVRSTYSNVDFPSFLNLIQTAEAQGLTIDTLSIDSAGAAGFVNASLVIEAR